MWLLIGGDSEIGAATARHLQARGEPVAATTRRRDQVAADRPFLDLAAPLDSFVVPPGTRGVCVLAAVARLADCEADPRGSAHINVTQTTALIERLLARDVSVVFISTDKVFDGSRPLAPADAPLAPACEYGRQKAHVETMLHGHIRRGAPVAILRLSKVVAPDMPLFTQWIAALSAGRPIRAFRDMTLAPVPIALASTAIAALLGDRASGIFQLSGPRDVSYAEAGRHLAERLGVAAALVEEASARDAGQPVGATVPHTSLDSRALAERFGIRVPDARDVLDGLLTR